VRSLSITVEVLAVASRSGLRVDPLDVPTSDSASPRTVDPPGQANASKARDKPVKVDGEILDQARAAVWWRMNNGDPTATLKGLLEEALRAELHRLAAKHNGGKPFLDVGALPRGGRVQPEEADPWDTEPTELSHHHDRIQQIRALCDEMLHALGDDVRRS
jgi:hypothetical protein